VRVTTLFNKLVRLPGLRVTGVEFEGRNREILVLKVARTFKLLTCPECGTEVRGRFEERAPRRWRHLSVLGHQTFLESPIRRLVCPDCDRVVTEDVPWARPRSNFTRPFEDTVALLAQKLSKTAVCEMMRISWVTVGSIAERVVIEKLDDDRLDHLRSIGVDEVSYRKPYRFLTTVVDHDSGAVVWAGEGKSSDTLKEFFAELGPERCERIEFVSMDMSAAYQKAVRDALPGAEIVFDRFHLAQLAQKALSAVRIEQRQEIERIAKTAPGGESTKGLRWILLKRPDSLKPDEKRRLSSLAELNDPLYRAYLLKESFLDLLTIRNRGEDAEEGLKAWLAWATRSRLAPFVKLARTVRDHREGILRALELPLSNARLEGTNNKIRLLSHRAFGFHSAAALIAMIYLCCSSITFPASLLHVF
jgi:transposase